ncbi:MAG TPA: DUF664 domain-containing protein, partial [Trebonia sp.]
MERRVGGLERVDGRRRRSPVPGAAGQGRAGDAAAVPAHVPEDAGAEVRRPRRGAARPQVGAAVPDVRGLLVHMIDEYARHCGHADLL